MPNNLYRRGLAAFAASALLLANPLSATANSHMAPEVDLVASAGDDALVDFEMQGQGSDRLANNRKYATRNFGRWRTFPRSMVLIIEGVEARSRTRPGGGGGGGGGGNGGGNGGGRPGRL